jgi:hypothetical protein
VSYAKALLATSKPADLHKPDELKKATGLSAEQMARLEREMASVSEDYKELEASYGDDMLVLVVASGFIERLLSKPEIEGFLERRHPEFLENFRAIVQATSLDQSTPPDGKSIGPGPKRRDRRRSRRMVRIKDGGGDGGEPARSARSAVIGLAACRDYGMMVRSAPMAAAHRRAPNDLGIIAHVR